MNGSFWRIVTAASLALVVAVPQRASAQQVAAASARRGYTEADVQFMQGMIAHHAQAVRMASLVATRSTRDLMHLLAERIAVSQRDEIRMMQGWLQDRREPVPHPDLGDAPHHGEGAAMAHGTDMHGDAHAMHMPGMLTEAQMAALAAAKGTEFDRLFLQGMIHHHEGALAMVATLFGTPGAAQESQIFGFATDVDADQRAEIARMRALLNTLSTDPARR